ncbi:OmpA family protein [Tenacibaculum sp. 190524A02b]|uniref:OmpA family protein n=1 Tax=Tenacibaculum vairaonense TaxID=3137860 RepID=A0ABM9PP88_9FLAO
MSNFLKAFLAFLCWSTIAIFVYGRHYNNTETVSTTPATKKIETNSETIQTEESKDSLKENSKVSKHQNSKPKEVPLLDNKTKPTPLKFKEKFITNSSHSRVLLPKKFFYFKDSIFNFLNNNPDKEIIITGYYLPKEAINDSLNLGIQRANYLKKKLINFGVNSKKIHEKSAKKDYIYDAEGYYAEGILIEYQNLSKEKIQNIEKDITNKTLNAYFGNNSFKPDRTLYTYTNEIKNYLNKYPSKKITIIGHTDNVGEESTNKLIGLQRAKSVADYFFEQGIDSTKITSISKGETSPIVDNNTQQNRAKNRRIEIIIN